METENIKKNTWKYIVYLTINIINNKIYIGYHKTENPDIFDGYIGNGVYITQPYTYKYAKTAFQYAVKKYGVANFKRVILKVFDTEEDASNYERELVDESFLKRDDVYNMILGGYNGMPDSEMIKVYQYDLNGYYVNEYKSFAEAALNLDCDYTLISYAVRHKTKARNFFWSTDKKDKIDLIDYKFGFGGNKKVYLYDLNGKYYKSYKTQKAAAEDLGITKGSVRMSAELGIVVNKKYQFSFCKCNTYSEAKSLYLQSRPVYRYDKFGNFDKAYNSQLEAEKENIGSNISKAIRLKTFCENGFLWGLYQLKTFSQKKYSNAKRKVGKYDINNNLIKIYDSATAAEKENGTSIWKVLNGTNKTHKNYIYKYLS